MKNILFILLTLYSNNSFSQEKITSVDVTDQSNYTRLVFNVTKPVEYSFLKLTSPDRLIIDVKDAKLSSEFKQPSESYQSIKKISAAIKDKTGVRLTVDLKGNLAYKSFTLRPNNTIGHRLVIDVYNDEAVSNNLQTEKTSDTKKTVTKNIKAKDIIVAIDAGHGGDDPGALGVNGTQEKDVVLSIAKKLAASINSKPGFKAILIRKDDSYVGLRERMDLARKTKADLFLSIHADAVDNRDVKGASVYTLSTKGASSEAARWLANKENSSDFVGGAKIDDKDDVLASVLIDLSQTACQTASASVATKILSNFGAIGSLHKKTVQSAGFMVLKSPDIPSLLIEVAFISNPSEEVNLKNSQHQGKISEAIFKGVVSYFKATNNNDRIIVTEK